MRKMFLSTLTVFSIFTNSAFADLWMYPANDNQVNGSDEVSLRYSLSEKTQLSLKVTGDVAERMIKMSEGNDFGDYSCDKKMGFCSKSIQNDLSITDAAVSEGLLEDNVHLSLYEDYAVLFYEGVVAEKIFQESALAGKDVKTFESEEDESKLFKYVLINENMACVEKYSNIAINIFYSDYSYRCMEYFKKENKKYNSIKSNIEDFRVFEGEFRFRMFNRSFI